MARAARTLAPKNALGSISSIGRAAFGAALGWALSTAATPPLAVAAASASAAATLAVPAAGLFAPLEPAQVRQAAQAIAAMQSDPRGPYAGVKWYCKDGVVLPPRAFACVSHGGGIQHGELSAAAQQLAALGLHVGTIIAALEPQELTANAAYRARALILERYLERTLDGWVLARARSLRGARQAEDEQAQARTLLTALAAGPTFLADQRLFLLRLMRALPYEHNTTLADEIRALAGLLGDGDPRGFGSLRAAIHANPSPNDIAGVDAYVRRLEKLPEAARLATLPAAPVPPPAAATPENAAAADASAPAPPRQIDLLTTARLLASQLRAFYPPDTSAAWLKEALIDLRAAPAQLRTAAESLSRTAPSDGDAWLRRAADLIAAAAASIKTGLITDPAQAARAAKRRENNLLYLHLMQRTELLLVQATRDLKERQLSRAQALEGLFLLARSAQHLGWLAPHELQAAQAALAAMQTGVPGSYLAGLKQCGRVLEWTRSRLVLTLEAALQRYGAVEPRAYGIIDDQLRSSVILPMAALLDRLHADVNRWYGAKPVLPGLNVGAGTLVRAENVGAAAGVLRVIDAASELTRVQPSDIVLLRELLPQLAPVAGIVSVGQVGSLSHVALLTRNLGIPHASISPDLALSLKELSGQEIFLGVSSSGRVGLGALARLPAREQAWFKQQATPATRGAAPLTIDAARLDTATRRILSLNDISERDIGVRVGPKAGQLGRLYRLFPNRVAPALVLPFGLFLQHVEQVPAGASASALESLRQGYQRAAALRGAAVEEALQATLTQFREAIFSLPWASGFVEQLSQALPQLGPVGHFGVFVRSDTNVEDLQDFTGAGLNLTVPHQVDPAHILEAIRQVWASPFTARAAGWRRGVVRNPEYIYPSVILHQSVPAEISGVIVTCDLETQEGGAFTVSAGEGVGAVVDGGAPETWVVRTDGATQLLSSARSLTRRVLAAPPLEGVEIKAAAGAEPLLTPEKIEQLRGLVEEVRTQAPAALPWDLEFGFVGERAYLMQMRPLKTSTAAGKHPFLQQLDAEVQPLPESLDLSVALP